MTKIFEVHFNPDAPKGEEQYTLVWGDDMSPLRVMAHLMRALAEGCFEMEGMIKDLDQMIDKATKREGGPASESIQPD